ncbi:MAG: tetratricopeptide repeat protein [Leptonema sp. (in: bacteria)]
MKFLYSILILFLLTNPINPFDLEKTLNQIYEEKLKQIFSDYPEILVKENESLSSFPKTTYIFYLEDSDFILCKKNPKTTKLSKTQLKFKYRDQEFEEMGEFNNFLVKNFLEMQNITDAIEGFEKGYAEDPLFFAFLYNLGKLYLLNKEYAKSIFYFKKILYYFPNYPRVHYFLGKNYYLNNDEIQGEFHFRKSIQLEPDQMEYYTELIEILIEKKQIPKANLYYTYAEKKFENQNFFLIFKIKKLIKEKRFREAIHTIERIQNKEMKERDQLEIKLIYAQLLEQIQDLGRAKNIIEEILNSSNKDFFNKYPKKELIEQKERLEKLIKLNQ